MKRIDYILLIMFLSFSSCDMKTVNGGYYVICLTSDFKGVTIEGKYRLKLNNRSLEIRNNQVLKSVIFSAVADSVEGNIKIILMDLVGETEYDKLTDDGFTKEMMDLLLNRLIDALDNQIVSDISVKITKIESLNPQ